MDERAKIDNLKDALKELLEAIEHPGEYRKRLHEAQDSAKAVLKWIQQWEDK